MRFSVQVADDAAESEQQQPGGLTSRAWPDVYLEKHACHWEPHARDEAIAPDWPSQRSTWGSSVETSGPGESPCVHLRIVIYDAFKSLWPTQLVSHRIHVFKQRSGVRSVGLHRSACRSLFSYRSNLVVLWEKAICNVVMAVLVSINHLGRLGEIGGKINSHWLLLRAPFHALDGLDARRAMHASESWTQ